MFMDAQTHADRLGRPILDDCIVLYHERRQFRLENLRLVLKYAVDAESEIDEGLREGFQKAADIIVNKGTGQAPSGESFASKCSSAMAAIRREIHDLGERIQNASVVGQLNDMSGTTTFHRHSLARQHESLGAIQYYLIKGKYTDIADFTSLLSVAKGFDKYDNLLVHLVPSIIGSITQFGSQDGSATLRESRSLDEKITSSRENEPWVLQSFQASVTMWWLSEYCSWYSDNPVGSPLAGVDLRKEADVRADQYKKALNEGALDFGLSISADVKGVDWFDPEKNKLRDTIQQKSPPMLPDGTPFSGYFQLLVTELLEDFAHAMISNMPNELRQVKYDDDTRRHDLRSNEDPTYDLEKFLLMLSYVYEDRPDSALEFWEDQESNLHGFLLFASREQPTMLTAAFCETLSSLAHGQGSAAAAHTFLLAENQGTSSRLKKTASISWQQILDSLQYYSVKIMERPAVLQPNIYRGGRPPNDEAELELDVMIMLQSYLRLISQLCRESSEARVWLLNQQAVRPVELLLHFCSSGILSQLRACAFQTLESLLTDKTSQVSDFLWQSLDQWIAGGVSPLAGPPKNPATIVPPGSPSHIMEGLAYGFEEPNAFVRLLNGLVAPYSDESGLHDGLPFPENLGSAYRMPGIDSYVDFVVGLVFGLRTSEQVDIVQLRLLRLSCLEFICTCLRTFNEDLLIFANGSNVSVDSAMKTSSLASYACLHPFARVMEWMFNGKVVKALFAAAHQDAEEISHASPDSPLILGLHRSIEAMTLIMKLQATFTDIVRPLVRASATSRTSVAEAALASFEDCVLMLNNLELVVDLGLYCSTGHQDLTLASLHLLELLSTANKLISATDASGRQSTRNVVIGILEMRQESDRIAKSLTAQIEPNMNDIAQGQDSSGIVIKNSIVNFLNSCMAALPDRPSLAHLLLGFSIVGEDLDVRSDSPFANDESLFHSLLQLLLEYPDGDDVVGELSAWLMHLKQSVFQVLARLWRSPLSSVYTMTELRANDFLFAQFLRQKVVDSNTLWEGKSVLDDTFLLGDSATCAREFLIQRAMLLDYTATEVHHIASERAPSLKGRVLSTLLGSTSVSPDEQIPNVTVFELFDFIELDLGVSLMEPSLNKFAGIDLTICAREGPGGVVVYDLPSVEQLLTLQQCELKKNGKLQPAEQAACLDEANMLLTSLHANNQKRQLEMARFETLKMWVQLMVVILDSCDFEAHGKTAFILQALQVILPKIESFSTESSEDTLELTRLARALMLHLDFGSSVFAKGRAGDVANDRLYQLFRVCLSGIHKPIATSALRENYYNICYRYLTGVADIASAGKNMKRHSIQTIKSSGDKLIDVLCEDAYGGDDTCRVAALLLLDALTALSQHEDSDYLLRSLVRVNFVAILVDSIKTMPLELRQTSAKGK
jgi:nuclear pore complex protein Nup205